jgi:hypothetical protein
MRVNFAEIKKVSIIDFLAHVGIKPVRTYIGYALYNAPYREDIRPSFKVSKRKNRWYDLLSCESGDIIDLGRRLYNTNNIFEVVHRIAAFDSSIIERPFVKAKPISEYSSGTYNNIRTRPLEMPLLLSYMATRGIDLDIAKKYCVEIHYRIGGKNYCCLGFKNIRNGYEVSNSSFKDCLGPKDISLIQQKANNLDCTIFEDFMDFLSYMTFSKRSDFVQMSETMDFLILNSVSNLQKAIPWLMQYETITCCLDNDDAGRKVVDFLSEMRDGIFDASNAYNGYKDLNDFLTKKPYCP